MEYVDEHDFSKTVRRKIVDAPSSRTWRQLQQTFDPGYHYDNLRFYEIAKEIHHIAGQ